MVQINAVVQIYLYLAFVYDNRLERKENIKVARPSIFVGAPSIFKSLTLKQIDLFCKNIITRVLRHYNNNNNNNNNFIYIALKSNNCPKRYDIIIMILFFRQSE